MQPQPSEANSTREQLLKSPPADNDPTETSPHERSGLLSKPYVCATLVTAIMDVLCTAAIIGAIDDSDETIAIWDSNYAYSSSMFDVLWLAVLRAVVQLTAVLSTRSSFSCRVRSAGHFSVASCLLVFMKVPSIATDFLGTE